MSLQRPTIAELEARAQADLAARIKDASPALRRGILPALARTLAAAVHLLYGYANGVALQCHPLTATGSFLELWASLWGIARKPPATGSGSAQVTGAVGTVIPADSRLQSTVGAEYAVSADATIASGGMGTVTLVAILTGSTANLAAGAILNFISPIPSVGLTAVVAAPGIAGGADVESDDDLRVRLLQRVQNPPHGGNQADYVGWALSISGITRAWCFPAYAGPGSVRVYIADDSYVGANLASAGDVAAVAAFIETVRPVGAVVANGGGTVTGVSVVAPVKAGVNFSLSISPDTAMIRADIQQNLADLFAREAAPEGTLRLSRIREAIGAATGIYDYSLSTPSTNVTASAGQILTLGTFTWL